MATNFHNKKYARSLAFITRFKVARKWPVEYAFVCYALFCLISILHNDRLPTVYSSLNKLFYDQLNFELFSCTFKSFYYKAL